MKTLRGIIELFVVVMIALFISISAGLPTWGYALIIGGFVLFGLLPKPAQIAMMAVDVELWKHWIVEKLFANNQFLNFARNADGEVLSGRIVHIPQAGAASGVEVDRAQIPAIVYDRHDVDVLYALGEFTTNPRRIPYVDKMLSYDKMNSAMGQDMNSLKDLVALMMLYYWAPTAAAAYCIATSGAAASGNTYLKDATGNCKKLALDEIYEAQTRMDELNLPGDGRYLMFDARMYKQFVSLLNSTDYRDFSRIVDPTTGEVGQFAGFHILKRSKTLRFSSDGVTAKDPRAANEAGDLGAALAWHSDWVERAIGDIQLFQDPKNPLYYGDIYSLLVMAGGRKIDQDGDGVIAIVQSK